MSWKSFWFGSWDDKSDLKAEKAGGRRGASVKHRHISKGNRQVSPRRHLVAMATVKNGDFIFDPSNDR